MYSGFNDMDLVPNLSNTREKEKRKLGMSQESLALHKKEIVWPKPSMLTVVRWFKHRYMLRNHYKILEMVLSIETILTTYTGMDDSWNWYIMDKYIKSYCEPWMELEMAIG